MVERAREGVMNHLATEIPGALVWDVYAGSGILGFECMSRGAKRLVSVDKNAQVAEAIRASAEVLGWENRVQVLQMDAHRIPSLEPRLPAPDLVFFDPPYSDFEKEGPVRSKIWELFISLASLMNPGGCAVAHTPGPTLKEEETEVLPGLECREYGSSALWWWHKKP